MSNLKKKNPSKLNLEVKKNKIKRNFKNRIF